RAGANPRHTEHEVGLDSSAHFMHVVMDAELKRNHGFQSVEHTVCSGDQVHTTEELEDVANCVADRASHTIRDHVATTTKSARSKTCAIVASCENYISIRNGDNVAVWEDNDVASDTIRW